MLFSPQLLLLQLRTGRYMALSCPRKPSGSPGRRRQGRELLNGVPGTIDEATARLWQEFTTDR